MGNWNCRNAPEKAAEEFLSHLLAKGFASFVAEGGNQEKEKNNASIFKAKVLHFLQEKNFKCTFFVACEPYMP